MYYLSLDTESGGITHDFSLLSASPIVFDANGEVLDTLNLLLKPDDGKYIISAEAMSVNRIDLIEHDKVALKYKDSKPILYNFLKNNYEKYGTLTAVGQNIGHDISYICDYIISSNSWTQYVDRRTVDLIALSKFFQLKGLIPMDQSLNLQLLSKFWGIAVDNSETHTANYDALLNIKLFMKYKEYELQKI